MTPVTDPKKHLQDFIKSRDLKKTGLDDGIPDIPNFSVDTKSLKTV
tara:strand:- start:1141 stop:1278 length:138 start_codon:yes stop_codon:yes gene_type:complete